MDRVGIMQSSQSVVLSLGRAVAQVPGNKAAVGQYYNAAADRYVTFDGIVKALAKEVGKEPKIMLYDEGKVSLAKGEGVPFAPSTSSRRSAPPCRSPSLCMHLGHYCTTAASRGCAHCDHP